MKVIAREGVWASTYFKTAINHCIEADKLLRRLYSTDDLSEHIAIDERINEACAIAIVFSAMSVEAYMNDYLAQTMGEETFYEQHERKNSTEKLNLVLGADKHYGKKNVVSAVTNLFKDRNSLVHAKSHDISYESEVDDQQTQPVDIKPDSSTSTYWTEYCTSYVERANQAICAVLLLGEYMQQKAPCFRTDAYLLGLNSIPLLSIEIIDKIKNLCSTLGIFLHIMHEYIPNSHVEDTP